MLQRIMHARARQGDAYDGPRRVLFTWSSRHEAEFAVMDVAVYAAAACVPSSTPQTREPQQSMEIAICLAACIVHLCHALDASAEHVFSCTCSHIAKCAAFREPAAWLSICLHYTGKRSLEAPPVMQAKACALIDDGPVKLATAVNENK